MGNIQGTSGRSLPITNRNRYPQTPTSSTDTFVGCHGRRKHSCCRTTYGRKRQKIRSAPNHDSISHAESYAGELYYHNVKKLKKEECWETFAVFRIHKRPRQIHSVLFLSHNFGLVVHLLITHARKRPRVGLFFQGMRPEDIEDEDSVIFIDHTSLATVPGTSALGLFEIVEGVMSEYGEYDSDVNSSKVMTYIVDFIADCMCSDGCSMDSNKQTCLRISISG